ncbi:hypothetical protein V6260_12920 [Pseudoalteromonas aliena]|uniref:hypothetical protein n=1 Tax=Pseudoalteromonas aliena TaxID=247523 RepID=UPI00311FA77B
MVWLLLEGSQSAERAFSPVTALWLAAVPIIDAISTILRRVKKGQSPFKPDREHLHHILLRLGFSSRQALVVICFISALFAVVGVLGDVFNVPEYIMFYAFILLTVLYYFFMLRIWRISVRIRRFLNIK